MKRQTAESIVDAYAWAIELGVMDLPDEAEPKLDGLVDALRDFVILSMSDEMEEAK